MDSKRNYERTLYASEKNDIDIALAGEALVSQGLSIHEHPPTDKRTGTFMRCDPEFIADLQWMGFQMMSTAHNHSIDFGENGILRNIENRLARMSHRFQAHAFSGTGCAGNSCADRRRLSRLYVAKFSEAIYVLHAFEKKSRQTDKSDMELARQRFKAVLQERKRK